MCWLVSTFLIATSGKIGFYPLYRPLFKSLSVLSSAKFKEEAIKQELLEMEKRLAVFDFDHTIVDENTDLVVLGLLDKRKIPKTLSELRRGDGWTAYMQGVFKLLKKNKIYESNIKECIKKMKPVEGMIDLIKNLHHKNFDIIIISDSNSFFIDTWLQEYGLTKYIKRVFTNPAHFNSEGLLIIKGYHHQTECKLSTKNLCKGRILNEFIENEKQNMVFYKQIVYCGDGKNDFCPILRLSGHDLACARNKYKLVDVINDAKSGKLLNDKGKAHKIPCRVLVWDSGIEIWNEVDLLLD